ncbi:MAG: hypothetical protein ACXWNK_01455 [Vulcanimicrobiaceae bacterium]
METLVLPPARPVAPPSTDMKTTVVAVRPPTKPPAPALGLLVDTYA